MPDCVVLPAREQAGPGEGRPAVRIYLGTEDGQWRAERIFFYAIECVRDPYRTYQIHLMKNLNGFDRRGWRTGFTNYRFAVPEFAGFEGRAIYNDVDQIYLADPARLFDLDMGDHAYLSVSPEDTSVMLMGCGRMGRWWTQAAATGGDKRALLRGPSSEPGAWGQLDGSWNARDMEFVHGESGLLHYTALHLQPWRPFPEAYSYHGHPLAELWLGLERRANARGYQVFTPERPTAQFAISVDHYRAKPPSSAMQASAAAFLQSVQPRRGLAVIMDAATRESFWRLPEGAEPLACAVSRIGTCTGYFDAVLAGGVLEELPGEDVAWIIQALFTRAARAVWIGVHCGAGSSREADVDVRRCLRPVRWWHQQIAAVAGRFPRLRWQLDALDDAGLHTIRADGLPAASPSVWLLEGAHAGDNAQLHQLVEALGWPAESKSLRYNRLHVLPNPVLGVSLANLSPASRPQLAPPWPDVVVASGKRNSGVARWIKRQSGGRTKLVHLGRPWARMDAFDLIVTTPQYRLPLRDNVHRNKLPLTSVSREALARRRRDIEADFGGLPPPLIALLVGGDSWSYVLGPAAARWVGQRANQRAREAGGALLVTTGPRTAPRSARALFSAIDVPCRSYDFSTPGQQNPYSDFLAVADEILVTGESASMIADAVATGKKVSILPLPRRMLARCSALAGRVIRLFKGTSRRGTPTQQGATGRFYDRLIERGLVTPARDLEHLHDVLASHGSLRPSERNPAIDTTADEALQRTVERVEGLFSAGTRVGLQRPE